jgi:hypothetical protein
MPLWHGGAEVPGGDITGVLGLGGMPWLLIDKH